MKKTYSLNDPKVISKISNLIDRKIEKVSSEGKDLSSELDYIISKALAVKAEVQNYSDIAPWVQEKVDSIYQELDGIYDFVSNRFEKKASKDHEMQMAQSQLLSIMENAENLKEMLNTLPEDYELMAWVQAKLTLASSFLNKVRDYMRNKLQASITASREDAKDLKLYDKAVREAKDKYEVWPSAYASGYVVKRYKELYKEKHGSGSPYKGKKPKASFNTEAKGLKTWFDEKWVDISRENEDGSHPSCGRPGGDLSEKDFKKRYPKCVPESKADKMTDKEKESAVRRKRDKVREKQKPGKPVYVNTDPKK